MTISMTVAKQYSVGGKTFVEQKTLVGDVGPVAEKSVSAAQAGTLTTRTDNDTGTITMSSGSHTITTGARLDIYWPAGARRGMTVGTVSTTSVPIDGGAGDNLPVATTVIYACIPVALDFKLIGNNTVGFTVYSDVRGTVVFDNGSGTELYAKVFPDGPATDGWYNTNGVTNPLAGVTVLKVYLSHADITAARTLRAGGVHT